VAAVINLRSRDPIFNCLETLIKSLKAFFNLLVYKIWSAYIASSVRIKWHSGHDVLIQPWGILLRCTCLQAVQFSGQFFGEVWFIGVSRLLVIMPPPLIGGAIKR